MSASNPLTVAIIPHAPYSLARGGMEVQQDQTIAALERLGVTVKRLSPWDESVEADIVHVFGCEYAHTEAVERAKGAGFPVVVTPMFMPQRPLWQFALARHIGKILPPTAHSLRQRAVEGADAVIAISNEERRELGVAFGTDPKRVTTIPNGIEDRFFDATPDLFVEKYGISDFVLCVGSIEPRKNQIALLDACSALDVHVVCIGPVAPHGDEATADYASTFRSRVKSYDKALWIGGLSHDEPMLLSAYAAANTHALVSHTEAQGLVSMEAYAAGCNVVVSDLPHLHELFGEDVFFADPSSQRSIQEQLREALGTAVEPRSKSTRPSWLLTWDDVAARLLDVYLSEKK